MSEHRTDLLKRIRMMANRQRFKILQLTQERPISIVDLSAELKLAYTKTADYVAMLEKEDLVEKVRDGKEVLVKSKVLLDEKKVQFL